MKIAHFILAHSHPHQLQLLLQKLWHPSGFCYVHIDAKQDLAEFEHLSRLPQVAFIKKRASISWGAYSMVQATLNGFSEILASGNSFDYINLLSGQDYPLAPIHSFHQFLAANNGKLFCEFYSVHNTWTEAIPRIKRYHFTHYRFPMRYKAESLVNALLPARHMPCGLVPVGRSQWFTITAAAAAYTVQYLAEHRNVARFFKLSWAPDELIFQTLLYNSHFREHMENNNLRYIDWSEGKASPKTLTLQDAPAMLRSGAFFARKLNLQTDKSLFAAIDAGAHGNNQAVTTESEEAICFSQFSEA